VARDRTGETPLTATFAYNFQDARVRKTIGNIRTDLLCDVPHTVLKISGGV
jgi:hypothetical protein